jgi:hypothetical protein
VSGDVVEFGYWARSTGCLDLVVTSVRVEVYNYDSINGAPRLVGALTGTTGAGGYFGPLTVGMPVLYPVRSTVGGVEVITWEDRNFSVNVPVQGNTGCDDIHLEIGVASTADPTKTMLWRAEYFVNMGPYC